MAVRMATLTACHHSAQKKPAATHTATQTTVTYEKQAPVFEFVAPTEHFSFAPDDTYAAPTSGYVAPAIAGTFTEPVPVIEYVSFALDDTTVHQRQRLNTWRPHPPSPSLRLLQ